MSLLLARAAPALVLDRLARTALARGCSSPPAYRDALGQVAVGVPPTPAPAARALRPDRLARTRFEPDCSLPSAYDDAPGQVDDDTSRLLAPVSPALASA